MYSSRLPWRLLGLLLLILAPVGAAVTSTSVSTDTDLQTALVDESIHEIIVEQDIEFDSAHWDDWYSRAEPYIRTSNLTIRGFPPLRRLDFAFTGDSRYGLDAGVFLNLSDLVIGHARYGAGVQFDFLAPSPGSYLLLWNSVMIRMACISSTREPDAVAVQPRLPGFPGVQRAVYQDNFCVRRDCFDNVLVYEDYTRITGTSSEDTAAGSYAMVMRNFTKVCRKYIDACDPSQSVDACVRKELDATSDVPTPGQLALAAQKAEQQRRNNTIIGAAVGAVCGAILLLIAAVLLIRRQRRRRRAQEKEQKLLLSVKASPTTVQASPATDSSPDLELGIVDPARNSPANPKLMVAPGTPPNRHNSWELAACKTSERFLHSQNNSSSDVAQHWLSGSNAGGNSSWYMRGPGSSATSALHSHDGAPSTADMIAGNAGNDRVTLGILLGAGSFGRVYKGKWRGMDVAVKVLQHSRAAAASVANEVDLMMSFQHPHIVSAHHFVSWRKRNPPKVAAFETVANDVPHPSSWAAGIDNSFADTAGPTGEYPEDTQTWIVQEFCDAGNLCEYLTSRGDWQEGQLPDGHSMLKLLFRLREVADGMSYLHRHTVVHGDLKSGNVLLTTSRTAPYGRIAKITDFGLSRAMATGQTHRSTHTLGTVSHMAPELLRYGKMAPSCDVFSFGIMMWELLTSRIAFSGLHYGAIIERVALMGERPTVPSGTPEDYSLLMGSCWSADPEQRPTFDQVVRCLDIMITSRQQELAVAKSGSTANNDSTNSETQQALLLAGQSTGAPTGPPTAPINQQQLNRAISNSSGEFDMSTRGHSSSRYASTRSGQGAVPPTPDVGPGQGARSASGYLGSFGPQDL